MKHCAKCEVEVDTHQNYCPLCYNLLTEQSPKLTPEMFELNKQAKLSKKDKLLVKIFLALSIAVWAVCIFVNVKYPQTLWSIIVAESIVYLWVLVCHTILSKDRLFKRVFLNFFSLMLLLLSIDLIFGWRGWSIQFAFPGLSMLTTCILSIVVVSLKQKQKYALGCFSSILWLILMSAILLLCKLDSYALINQIALVVQCIFLLLYFMFAGKTIFSEFRRIFHL